MKKRFTSLNDLLMSANHLLLAVSLVMFSTILNSTITSAQGTWTKIADFPRVAGAAASFSIGTKGYIGIGSDNSGPRRDFWEWDQETNIWTRKADFPGKITSNAASFSIGTKGYIGTGWSSDPISDQSNELWEYNPVSNTWIQKASIPGTIGRSEAVGFSIGTKGYIATGWKWGDCNFYKDFWEWDQTTDIWTQKEDFKGVGRTGAIAFSIGDKGYIGTGWSFCEDTNLQDFWEWDQKTNVWTQKADYPGGLTVYAVGFSFGNKGYIGTGWVDSYKNEFWEWDQVTNIWKKEDDFGGYGRVGAVGFSIGNKGYIGTGYNPLNGRYEDFWEFAPSAITGIEEVAKESNFFYPNPASDIITLNTNHPGYEDMTLNIYNVSGELINSGTLRHNQQKINIEELSNGIYIVEIKSKEGSERQKLIVQR